MVDTESPFPFQDSSQLISSDSVRIKNLVLNVTVADGAQWPSDSGPKLQPVRVSLIIPHDLRAAASRDDISKSINYGELSRTILPAVQSISFLSLEALLDHLFEACFAAFETVDDLAIKLVKPRASPYADAVGVAGRRRKNGTRVGPEHILLEKLACNLIVGLNACEREDKQLVHFDVDISQTRLDSHFPFDFRGWAKALREGTEASAFISLESLASLVAEKTLERIGNGNDTVIVRAGKPKALVFAEAAEVELVRTVQDYPRFKTSFPNGSPYMSSSLLSRPLGLASPLADIIPPTLSPGPIHTVSVALGSNLGDRFANIEVALRFLEQPGRFLSSHPDAHVSVVNTSFMYETAPMYLTDQPKFANCACLIQTNLQPVELLVVLKAIEEIVGRVPSIRNGPRAIDLDILFFDQETIDTRPEVERCSLDNLQGHLIVPHPRIAEREFVLRPLNDMIPDFIHPVSKKSIHKMLSDIIEASPLGTPRMDKIVPFPSYPLTSTSAPVPLGVPSTGACWVFPLPAGQSQPPKRPLNKTRIMATLNATPDSFSDGAVNNTISTALTYVATSVRGGADIVDIGGYSTRPGSAYVSPEEEITRIVPIIQAIRASTDLDVSARNILISVDTFRPDVARAAIEAGANCINDVYAFTGPTHPLTAESAKHLLEMRHVARELAVPVVLMHARGDPRSNKDYSTFDSVAMAVAAELGEKVDAIVNGPGGVRRWLIMVDPGIGFSKSVDGNLELLRGAALLTSDRVGQTMNPLRGYPQLIGASRKSFLGMILADADGEGPYVGRETAPKDRGWATAAAVASAVQQGAAVVRVHDVLELGDVVRVADRLWQ
ncbi:Dihydropteroate synthase-like protein [Amylostereum chailletii]|nr:Dihydropteroate synthase-like protein [Amylostereum chailletii]